MPRPGLSPGSALPSSSLHSHRHSPHPLPTSLRLLLPHLPLSTTKKKRRRRKRKREREGEGESESERKRRKRFAQVSGGPTSVAVFGWRKESEQERTNYGAVGGESENESERRWSQSRRPGDHVSSGGGAR
jgi:hypothetical protein